MDWHRITAWGGGALTIAGIAAARIKHVRDALTAPYRGYLSLKKAVITLMEMNERQIRNTDAINDIRSTVSTDQSLVKEMLEDAHDGRFYADLNGNYIWLNRTLARFVDRFKEDLLQRGWENFVVDCDREKFVRDWDRAVSTYSAFSFKTSLLKNGVPVKMSFHGAPIRCAMGTVTMFSGRWELMAGN
jgi:PAS domain-containing protein